MSKHLNVSDYADNIFNAPDILCLLSDGIILTDIGICHLVSSVSNVPLVEVWGTVTTLLYGE